MFLLKEGCGHGNEEGLKNISNATVKKA